MIQFVALADQILALHAEYDRQWDEHDAIEEQHRTAGTATATLVRDSCRFLDEIHPLSRRVMALRQEMARTPATTMAGFRAKALIVEQFLDCWPGDQPAPRTKPSHGRWPTICWASHQSGENRQDMEDV